MNMIDVDVRKLAPQEAYKILTGSVVPRPIAWVSSIGADGVANLAPFSFFTAICSNPPSVLFCPVTPGDLKVKDTLRNVRETREFVVNVATEANAEKLNQTSAPYPADVSEFSAVGLTPLKSTIVKPPRVAEAPIQLECELIDIVQVGDGTAGSGHIVIGKMVYAHLSSDVCDEGLHVDISRLKPISRLAGSDYAPVREIFSLKRPMTA